MLCYSCFSSLSKTVPIWMTSSINTVLLNYLRAVVQLVHHIWHLLQYLINKGKFYFIPFWVHFDVGLASNCWIATDAVYMTGECQTKIVSWAVNCYQLALWLLVDWLTPASFKWNKRWDEKHQNWIESSRINDWWKIQGNLGMHAESQPYDTKYNWQEAYFWYTNYSWSCKRKIS
jgi:hypothetical protein